MTDQQPTSVAYFIKSRPAPDQPWRWRTDNQFMWEFKALALKKLADRRSMQPTWEHRLMERVTTVVERPATEDG